MEAIGMIIAFGFYLVIMLGAASVIRTQTGVVINPYEWGIR